LRLVVLANTANPIYKNAMRSIACEKPMHFLQRFFQLCPYN